MYNKIIHLYKKNSVIKMIAINDVCVSMVYRILKL